jgi:hypothetical protein
LGIIEEQIGATLPYVEIYYEGNLILDDWNDIDKIYDYNFTDQCIDKLTLNFYKKNIDLNIINII